VVAVVSADTEALLATVREEQRRSDPARRGGLEFALTVFAPALDSLAAELEMMRDHIEHREDQLRARPEQLAEALFAAEADLERVKAERDVLFKGDWAALNLRVEMAEARLDKALSALREIAGHPLYAGHPFQEIARAAIAEIEGDPEWKQQEC
jgi:hypothetical protein